MVAADYAALRWGVQGTLPFNNGDTQNYGKNYNNYYF
jgi:hypothetical protein